MPVVAYVTRTFGSRTFAGPSQVSGDGAGGVGYVLRAADGRTLGNFKDIAAAQAAFARYYGNRILRWQREDLQNVIEQWVAIGLPLDPRDIWVAPPLLQWIQPSAVPGSVLLANANLLTIQQVYDLSGNGTILVPANSPTLVQSDPNISDKSAIVMVQTSVQGFTAPSQPNISTPYTVTVVADADAAPGVPRELIWIGQGQPLLIGIAPDGAWYISVSGVGTIIAAGGSGYSTITVEADGTNVQARVNGVDVGTIAGTPDPGPLIVGGIPPSTGNPFSGRLAFLMIASGVDKSGALVRQTERYIDTYFNPS